MAEFGANVTSVSEPRGAGTEVLKPVTSNIGESIVNALETAVDIFSNVSAKKQKEAEKGVLGDYTKKLQRIESAFRSGQYTSEQAMLKREELKSSMAGAYPDFVEDFDNITTKFSRGTALERADKNVEDVRQRRNKDITDASNRGVLFLPSMSQQQEDDLIAADKKSQRARQELQEYRESQRFMWESGKQTREEMDRSDREMAIKTLNTVGATNVEMFNTYVSSIYDRVTTKNLPVEQASQELAQVFTTFQQQVRATAGRFPELASQYGGLYDEMYKTAQKMIDPKQRSENLVAAWNGYVASGQLAIAQNSPKARNLMFSNKMFGSMVNNVLSVGMAEQAILLGLGEKAEGALPPDVAGREGADKVVDVLKKNAAVAANAPAERREGAMEVMGNSYNNVLTDLSNKFKLGVPLDTKQVRSIAKLVADPQFATYVAEGKVDPDVVATASFAFEKLYTGQIGNQIVKLFSEDISLPGNQSAKLTDLVEIVPGVTGLSVRRKEYKTANPYASGADDLQILGAQNRAAGAVRALDELVKMGAHAEGHKDYKRTWEENKHKFLPGMFPDPEQKVKKPQQATEGAGGYSLESNLKAIAGGTDTGAGMTREVIDSVMKDLDKLTPEQRKQFQDALKKLGG